MTINFNHKLLIFMAVIVIISLFVTGIPNKFLIRLTVGEEYNNIHSEYENMYQNLNMKSVYEKTKIELLTKLNELNIDSEILQDNIINVLSNISEKNDIELGNMKFSETMPVYTDNSKGQEESENLTTMASQQGSTAVCMKVTLDFDCDFNDMLLFIDDIKNNETEISVIDISILMIDVNKVHVMLNLMFYALPL